MVVVLSDAEVMDRSVVEARAFAEIFDRHFVRIHAYLARRVGTAADDLAADVFTIAFDRRSTYDGSRASALPWLYGIASNLLLARSRRVQRDAALVDRLHARRGADVRNDPQELLAGGSPEDAEVLTRLVALLSDDDLTTLVLYAWEDLAYDAIAAALDIPVGTVRSRLHRVRRIASELRAASGATTSEPTHDPRDPHGR